MSRGSVRPGVIVSQQMETLTSRSGSANTLDAVWNACRIRNLLLMWNIQPLEI